MSDQLTAAHLARAADREVVKMSVQQPAGKLQEQMRCEHHWVRRPALIFKYIKPDWHCYKCGGWKGKPQSGPPW